MEGDQLCQPPVKYTAFTPNSIHFYVIYADILYQVTRLREAAINHRSAAVT